MINEKKNGFYIGSIENPDAEIKYIDAENISITHTFVSEKLRGQGIALQLLEKVVKYAKEKNKKIIPVCSYAAKKLREDKYQDIIFK